MLVVLMMGTLMFVTSQICVLFFECLLLSVKLRNFYETLRAHGSNFKKLGGFKAEVVSYKNECSNSNHHGGNGYLHDTHGISSHM